MCAVSLIELQTVCLWKPFLHKPHLGILKLLKTSLFYDLLQNYTVMCFFFFSVDGQLRHIHTGEPFVFNYKEDLHRWNQKRYEALGEVMFIIIQKKYIKCDIVLSSQISLGSYVCNISIYFNIYSFIYATF